MRCHLPNKSFVTGSAPFFKQALLLAIASCFAAPPLLAQEAATGEEVLPDVRIIATTPVGSTGIPITKFAGNVQTINQKDMPRDLQGFTDVLNQNIGSVHLNDTQGNPYNIDLMYRGFTASPILGSSQGISVFLDGMRVNEPFGDIVAWDLIPQIAIANTLVVPGSNPVYGLNTLGGAVAMTTKRGFTNEGSEAKLTLGSYNRRSIEAEKGGHSENTDYYFATSLYEDSGWATYNPSTVRQFFGKLGFMDEKRDIQFSFAYSDNSLYGNQSTPLTWRAAGNKSYTHDDYTNTQNLTLNLKGELDMGDDKTVAGNVYYRWIRRDVLNSNLNNVSLGADVTCTSATCVASNIFANYTQDIVGANAQWSALDKLWERSNTMTLGTNIEYGRTTFTNKGQNAYVDSSYGLVAVDAYQDQANITSTNGRYGLFATDTLDMTDKFAVTASARLDYASVQLNGSACSGSTYNSDNSLCGFDTSLDTTTPVSGNYSYTRLNPSVGTTYQLSPQTTSFATYSEGFRTPSAIELACADADNPCTGIPNAFGADPYLKAVVSKTLEFGLRGKISDAAMWSFAVFRTDLYNDILFKATTTNKGYFSNVGQTRRQGLELGVHGNLSRFDYAANLSWIEATFQSSFTIANTSNSSASTDAKAGDKIPGIPEGVLKLKLGYALSDASHIGATVHAQGSQYARGDENNLDSNGKVPGYAIMNIDGSHRISKTFEFFGGISNLFDQTYATYGVLGQNNLSSGGDEQFRSYGAPRTYFVGVRGSF